MQKAKTNEIIINDEKTLGQFLNYQQGKLINCTIQNLDLSQSSIDWSSVTFQNVAFLGCTLNDNLECILGEQEDVMVFPKFNKLPYEPYRKSLYSASELLQGFERAEAAYIDLNIYEHFSETRFNPHIKEALAQRIHDHAIDDALRSLLHLKEDGLPEKKCIGIMGGHSTSRKDPFFIAVAHCAKRLSEEGYFIASGGGPGIMEAANLGAYFAGKKDSDLQKALNILQQIPVYSDRSKSATHPDNKQQFFDYIQAAREVLTLYPEGNENLAIPTWFYGHEPSNLFAGHIAKYFSNSIREDTLLAISLYGIIFAPGSAGTIQEIFMDAAQNHYGTYGHYSPMVFLSTYHYSIKTIIYPLLRQLAHGKKYGEMLYLSDEPEDIVRFIKAHPPVKV